MSRIGVARGRVVLTGANPQPILETDKQIIEALRQHADLARTRLQERLQIAASNEYRKGTGRFSRGIRVNRIISRSSDKVTATLQVRLPQYRETRFLTNLANQGYFKLFPVLGYRIYAKGARDAFDMLSFERRRGEKLTAKQMFRRLRSKEFAHLGRLKIPLRDTGVGMITFRPKAPRGSREEIGFVDHQGSQISTDRTVDMQSDYFMYPFFVRHPGFSKDIISDIVLSAGGQFQKESIELVNQRLQGLASRGLGLRPVGRTVTVSRRTTGGTR